MVGMKFIREAWTKVTRVCNHQNPSVCEYPHLKLTIILLKFFGLWPYQSTFTKTCNYFIFVTWTVTFMIAMVQGLRDKTNRMSTEILAESIIFLLWVSGTLIQATMLFMRPQWLKKLYGQIENDLKSITNAEELAILQKFSRHGYYLNLIYIGTSAVGYFGFLVLVFLPFYLNTDTEKDITDVFPCYSKHLIISDNARDIQTIVHVHLETIYGALVHITVIAMYMCSVKHTCGMYAIASHRLRNLVPACDKIFPSKMESDTTIVPQMLDIIKKHRAAIKSAHIVGRTFSRTFFGAQFVVLICSALLIFDLSLNISNIYSTVKMFFVGMVLVQHMLYMNYGGQQIIEFSNKVFTSTYFMDWHLLSTNARKILSMIIFRSSKTKTLSAGGMIFSLETFTTIIKASWSLATAFLSIHKGSIHREY